MHATYEYTLAYQVSFTSTRERKGSEKRRGEIEEGEGETETLLTALTVLSSRVRKGKRRGRGEGGERET